MLCVLAYGRGIGFSRNSNSGSDRQIKENRPNRNYSDMCNAVAPSPAAYVYAHANSVLKNRFQRGQFLICFIREVLDITGFYVKTRNHFILSEKHIIARYHDTVDR